MRIIKFRAWDKDNKKMLFELDLVGRITFYNGLKMIGDSYEPLMQFTGLTDKNGKEIYEGDIVKNTRHNNQLIEIFWEGCITGDENNINGINYINWGGWYFKKLPKDKEMTMATYKNDIEVVGNIYENPDLMAK